MSILSKKLENSLSYVFFVQILEKAWVDHILSISSRGGGGAPPGFATDLLIHKNETINV